ncbi:hypothetical protein [Bacillus wiedmannii]|uniref:hypothetical protein n=1 Tax=Bacillus wiedmannii TaxID=1890302 RepID=UPI003D21FCA0
MKYIKRDTGKSVNLHEELGFDVLQIPHTTVTFEDYSELSNLLFLGIMKRMQGIQCKLHLTIESAEFESMQFEVKEDNGHHLFFVGDDLVSARKISSMDVFYNLHKELVIRLYYFSKGVKKYILLRFVPVESVCGKLMTALDKRFNSTLDMSKLTNNPLERAVREAQIDAVIKPKVNLRGRKTGISNFKCWHDSKPLRTPVMFRGHWATEPEQSKPNNFELDRDTHITEALMQ